MPDATGKFLGIIVPREAWERIFGQEDRNDGNQDCMDSLSRWPQTRRAQLDDGMSLTTLSIEDAEDYVYGATDHVAILEVSQHRWYVKRLVVFRDTDGGLYGFHYLDPATEEQEGQDRFEADPVPCFPVVSREVVTTVYERA